jgi:hypothetical protein
MVLCKQGDEPVGAEVLSLLVSDGGDREANELGLVEVLLVAGAKEDAKSIKFSLAEVACAHNWSREWDQQLVVYTICDVHTLALAGGKGVPNMSGIYW